MREPLRGLRLVSKSERRVLVPPMSPARIMRELSRKKDSLSRPDLVDSCKGETENREPGEKVTWRSLEGGW